MYLIQINLSLLLFVPDKSMQIRRYSLFKRLDLPLCCG